MKIDNNYYDEAWCQWDDMKEYGPVAFWGQRYFVLCRTA